MDKEDKKLLYVVDAVCTAYETKDNKDLDYALTLCNEIFITPDGVLNTTRLNRIKEITKGQIKADYIKKDDGINESKQIGIVYKDIGFLLGKE